MIDGNRFVNELALTPILGKAIKDQKDGDMPQLDLRSGFRGSGRSDEEIQGSRLLR